MTGFAVKLDENLSRTQLSGRPPSRISVNSRSGSGGLSR